MYRYVSILKKRKACCFDFGIPLFATVVCFLLYVRRIFLGFVWQSVNNDLLSQKSCISVANNCFNVRKRLGNGVFLLETD